MVLLKYLLVLEMMILGAFYEDLNSFRVSRRRAEGLITLLLDVKQDEAWHGIGTPEEVIAGLENDSNDNFINIKLIVDFFNSAITVIKPEKKHLEEIIDEEFKNWLKDSKGGRHND